MIRNKGRVVLVLAVILLLFWGLQHDAESQTKKSPQDLKVAVVFLGPVSDGGYNSAAYIGLEKVKEKLGSHIAYAEVGFADVELTFKNFGAQGYDIVFGHSGAMQESMKKVAPQYPNTRYVEIAGRVEGIANVTAIDYKRDDIGFLAGIVAGVLTKSNKVGIVQGMEFPSTRLIQAGYEMGAKQLNPKAVAFSAYLGTFNDMVKGKEAALAQISQGVDIIAHNAGWGGTGMIQAVKEKDIYGIGYPWDQNSLAPKNVITSINVKFDEILLDIVDKYSKGDLKSGTYNKTIANGGISLTSFYGLITPEQNKRIEDVFNKVKAGEIKVDAKKK